MFCFDTDEAVLVGVSKCPPSSFKKTNVIEDIIQRDLRHNNIDVCINQNFNSQVAHIFNATVN